MNYPSGELKNRPRSDHQLFAGSDIAEAVWPSPMGASEAYRVMIELDLSRGRNAMGIWQDLVDTHGFTDDYRSVKRSVASFAVRRRQKRA